MPGARVTAGDRVTFRTAERDDLPFLQRAFADPAVRYPMGNPVKNRSELEEWLFEGEEDRFVVCLDDESADPVDPGDATRPVGIVTVEGTSWRRPELAYWLVPEVHGDGYGTESVSLAVDYVFRTYDHPAVEAAAYDFNDASRGLLESLGFEEEGRLRKQRFVDGEYIDTVLYGLLRENWDLSR